MQLVPVEGFALRDCQVLHLGRHGTVCVAKEEHALVGVNPQEGGDIGTVVQRGREAHKAHGLGGGLHLEDGPGHQALPHRAAVIIDQVDLIQDHQAHKLGVRPALSLVGNDVPLLVHGHNHLGIADFLPGEADVARELTDGDAVGRQALGKVLDNLLNRAFMGAM